MLRLWKLCGSTFCSSQVSHVATLELPLLMLGRAVGWLVSVHCPYLVAALRVSFQFFLVILVVFVPLPAVVAVVVAVLLPPVWQQTVWPV